MTDRSATASTLELIALLTEIVLHRWVYSFLRPYVISIMCLKHCMSQNFVLSEWSLSKLLITNASIQSLRSSIVGAFTQASNEVKQISIENFSLHAYLFP